MKAHKTPWRYESLTYDVTHGETFNGYDKKYNPSLRYTTHKILSGKIVIAEITYYTNNIELNDQVAADYALIVEAVNNFNVKPQKQG